MRQGINGCSSCGRPTSRPVCGLCKFEQGRAVPAETVAQLIEEAEAQELARQQGLRHKRREYTVRVMRVEAVVIVAQAHAGAAVGNGAEHLSRHHWRGYTLPGDGCDHG